MWYVCFILGYCMLVSMAYHTDNLVAKFLFGFASVCFATVFIMMEHVPDEIS